MPKVWISRGDGPRCQRKSLEWPCRSSPKICRPCSRWRARLERWAVKCSGLQAASDGPGFEAQDRQPRPSPAHMARIDEGKRPRTSDQAVVPFKRPDGSVEASFGPSETSSVPISWLRKLADMCAGVVLGGDFVDAHQFSRSPPNMEGLTAVQAALGAVTSLECYTCGRALPGGRGSTLGGRLPEGRRVSFS